MRGYRTSTPGDWARRFSQGIKQPIQAHLRRFVPWAVAGAAIGLSLSTAPNTLPVLVVLVTSGVAANPVLWLASSSEARNGLGLGLATALAGAMMTYLLTSGAQMPRAHPPTGWGKDSN